MTGGVKTLHDAFEGVTSATPASCSTSSTGQWYRTRRRYAKWERATFAKDKA